MEATFPQDTPEPQPTEGEAPVTDTGDEGEKRPEFYCPGCGRTYDYRQQCTGSPEAPHPPIEVVSTAELDGDPSEFTAAPNTGT